MRLLLHLVFAIVSSIFKLVNSNPPKFRVVGGWDTQITKFPYAAFLMFMCEGQKTGWACGSSIINPETLLTACHCVESFRMDHCKGMAFVGNKNKAMGRRHRIVKSIPHKDFDNDYINNDIALVKVAPHLRYNSTVQCLAIDTNIPAPTYGYLAGWGLIHEHPSKAADDLELGVLKLWNRDECMKKLHKKIPQGTFCAGDIKAVQYAASGDSGSAIVANHHDKLYGIGLVSFKYEESMTSMGVFTDIRYFYNWITQHTKLDCKQ